jgi:hypothetical protein
VSRCATASADAWRAALTAADVSALDEVGHGRYPYDSDPENRFLDVVW